MNVIADFNLYQLNNGSHFLYVNQVLGKAQADTTVSNKAAAYLAKLKAAVENEDRLLKLSPKNKLTDAIADADSSRDALYLGLKNAVRAFMRARSAELVDAAADLNQLLVDYRINTHAPLIKETGMMMNLVGDLNKKFKAQVEKLGLQVMVAELGEANDSVNSLMMERTEERKNVGKGELRAARLVTDEAYRLFVMMVNGLVFVEGEAGYLEFVKFVNAQILYYRREAMGQKASAPDSDGSRPGTDDEGTGDDTPGTETPGGGSGENPGGSTGGSGGDHTDFE